MLTEYLPTDPMWLATVTFVLQILLAVPIVALLGLSRKIGSFNAGLRALMISYIIALLLVTKTFHATVVFAGAIFWSVMWYKRTDPDYRRALPFIALCGVILLIGFYFMLWKSHQ